MSGGGSSGPQYSESTVTQQAIPKELMPFATDMLARTSALTDLNQNPYQQYQGQQFAGINPLQQQGYQGISQAGVAPQLNAATSLASNAGLAAMGGSNYQPVNQRNFFKTPTAGVQDINYTRTQAPQLQQYQMGPALAAQAPS